VGNGDERAVRKLLGDNRLGQKSDPGVDFHGTFQGFHIVEFHLGLNFQAAGGEDLVEALAGGHLRGQGDDFKLGKIAQGDGAFFGEGVTRGGDDVQGVLFKGFHLQPLAGRGEGDEADICVAIGDRLIHLVGTAVVDLHFHLGKGPEELLDIRWEFVDAHAGYGRQPDRS